MKTITSAVNPSSGDDVQRNWLRNPNFSQGEVFWEGQQPGQYVVDPVGVDGRPAVLLEQRSGERTPVLWRQRVLGTPPGRQFSFMARVWVVEGEAQLWLRCNRGDGTPIDGRHLRPWEAPRASATHGWQSLSCTFLVPSETALVEVGGMVADCGKAWFSDFALRLIPNDEHHLRAAMVETLIREGNLSGPECQRAFRQVPRHRFVPSCPLAAAYVDEGIGTRFLHQGDRRIAISSSSQPSVMATMLGQLRLRPGLKVLEIGTGTGYNAALLAEIVGAEKVISIDLDDEIVAQARAHLEHAGYDKVTVAVSDGWDGYRSAAPYDRIVVTAGVHDLAPAWMEQLRDKGILVAPFSFQSTQIAPAFRKQRDYLVSEQISPSYFMDLRGKRPRSFTHYYGASLTVSHDAIDAASLGVLNKILSSRTLPLVVPEIADLGTAVCGLFGPRTREFFDFVAFLSLVHPMVVGVSDPRLRPHGIRGMTYGIVDLEQRQAAFPTVAFGGRQIGEELRSQAQRWRSMASPGLDRLVMAAYPRTLYPAEDSLPSGEWMGLVAKGCAWYQWRYVQ